ncbi:MAG: hypothetical protein ABS36_03640 [Acidobacteria bacterium SCN 69-37]|nr:MAG: hypothetical protein ABS36_03640 [Acidobacteria bacterium SCN 69-37]
MTRRRRSWILGGLLTFLLGVAAPVAAQETAPAPATDSDQPAVTVPVTPGDMARIRKALDADPAVRIDDDQLRFYMQILVKRPTFAEFIKGYDFKNGPTRRGNPMTHNEFLAMVTPKELQSSVGITARETLEFALTNWLGQTLVKRAFEEIQQAKSEREIQEIRDRIDRELAALKASSGQ